MKVKGVVLDESNLNQIRLAGFSNFKEDSNGQMDYHDEDNFYDWEVIKMEELDKLTSNYMQGQDDAKLFVFSDSTIAQEAIKEVFPNLEFIEVNSEDYPFDYDYIRDKP